MAHPLVTVWTCYLVSILIMIVRLVLGRWVKARFNLGDTLTVLAILLAFARAAFTEIVITWKTNNLSSSERRRLPSMSEREIQHREIGSKLTVVARCVYILLLWTQKSVLLAFYRGIVKDMPWGPKVINAYWLTLAVTIAPCLITTFVGCSPFDHYWKVLVVPDSCTEAVRQLIVVGALNMFTDILLIMLPIPVLLQIHLTWKKKLQLAFLFSVGFFVVIVTAVRIPRTLRERTSETNRISWTTAEFLAATIVANSPTLYGFRKKLSRGKDERGRKTSRSGPHIRGVAAFSETTEVEEGANDKTVGPAHNGNLRQPCTE